MTRAELRAAHYRAQAREARAIGQQYAPGAIRSAYNAAAIECELAARAQEIVAENDRLYSEVPA